MEMKPNLKFYVLNWDHNQNKVIRFNIFNNINVYEETIKYVKKYLRNKKTFTYEQLKEEIRKTIQWQEWSRYEYEISVGRPFCDNIDELQKIDCYWQAEENIEGITDMAIKAVKQAMKEAKNG